MTKAEARVLLRNCPGGGGLEAWIAGRLWHVTPNGWIVDGMLHGWRFRVEVVANGLRISAGKPGAVPAVWTITAAGKVTGAG